MGPARSLCLVVLALTLGPGCSASRYAVPPGEQQATLAEVGLELELTGLLNARRRLSVWCEIRNTGTSELRFAREDVTMEIDGRRYLARDLEVLDFVVALPPGDVQHKLWGFHVGRVLEPGTYAINLRDVTELVDGVRQPDSLELVVPLTIPPGY